MFISYETKSKSDLVCLFHSGAQLSVQYMFTNDLIAAKATIILVIVRKIKLTPNSPEIDISKAGQSDQSFN